MAEVKGAGGENGGRREIWLALTVALALALLPVWRGLLDPGRVLFAVDTASVQLPWSASLGRGGAGGPPARARNPELSDQGLVFYPAYRWVAARLLAGELPLWNPYVQAGAPGVGNPQLGVLDPQVWLLALLERLGGRAAGDRGLALLAWLRLAAAGLGAYVLARRLGLTWRGAALAAVSFGGSGFVVLWLNHSLGHVAPALPWLLWFIEGTRAPDRRRRAALGAAATLALAILGGHPETAFFVGLTGGLWALGLWRRERRAALASLGALALGTLAAAASLLPFVEYARRSGARVARAALPHTPPDLVALGALISALGLLLWWRAGRARRPPGSEGADASGVTVAVVAALFAAAVFARFPWSALVHDLYGTPVAAGGYLAGGGYLERYSAWLAFPTVALALAGLFTAPGRLARQGAIALGGFGAWLLALELPAAAALLRWLPGAGLAAPARAAVVAVLLLSLLAGQALEHAGRPARVAGAALLLAACLQAHFAPAAHAPAAALPGDPPDELVTLVVARAEDAETVAVAGRVDPAVGAAELELVCEGWIGGDQFRPAGPGPLALQRGIDAQGATVFRAQLDERALPSGLWRISLALHDAGGARLGTRASDSFAVRHGPRYSGLSLALLAATLLCLTFGPPGTLGAGLLLALALLHAAIFARGAQPAVPRAECFPDTATTRILARELRGRRYFADRGVLPANTGMVFGLPALDGYDGLDVASFNELRFAALLPGSHPLLDWNPRGVDLDSAAFRLFGVGALVCARPLEHPAWRLVAGPSPEAGVEYAETWIYLPRDPLPRAFCVNRIESLAEVRADPRAFDPRRAAFLGGVAWAPDGPFGEARVRALSWEDERIELEVELDGEGLLVVTEQHFPGWSATVDGQARPVLAADGVFRGVPLRAGDRRVVLRYRPRSFRAGAWLSGLALAGMALAALWRKRPDPN